MKKLSILSIIALLLTIGTYAQKTGDVLMTINNKPVYAKEFKRVYTKNLDLVQDETQKSVEGYLDLFIEYKLKVAEAYAQKLNENEAYVYDFGKYEEQLSRNYIYDTKLTDDLIKEAYNRGLEEIEASHILVMCNWDAFAQDTLVAYNKVKALRDRALKGEDFNVLAKKNSEEPGANEREGKLGYFSAFNMVYPFETEAYKTPVGGISNIVRTQFGYHIIKVTDRRLKFPPITVSHIMISTSKDTTTKAKERINEIYGLLKQGESFEELAKKYSDDKATGINGGTMKPFTKGQLKAPPFEEAAYALKNTGEISNPVQTRFGWHIIRLEKINEIPSFEESQVDLEMRIKDSERLKIVTSAVNDKIKKKYGFEGYDYLPFFEKFVSDSILKRNWKFTSLRKEDNKPLFKIGSQTYFYNELAEYLFERQTKVRPYQQKRSLIQSLYDEFETEKVKTYFKRKLEEENDEYAGIIQEYRDGLLIFEVMAENVWNKAKNDTLRLQQFYNNSKENYKSNQQLNGAIFSSSQKEILTQVNELLASGKNPEEIKKQLNTTDKIQVLVTEGFFDLDNNQLPPNFELKEGISKIYETGSSFSLVKVNFVAPPRVRELDEVKGRVISDFQNTIEKEWVQSLKTKYTVEVNQKTLKKLKKELGS
ncbi:MAG: peptidylprolyl isomerase [Flavobacteriaceae bacterium]|nr:peptidylprolyl isomerase [Flavobacteriaceae bacterium]